MANGTHEKLRKAPTAVTSRLLVWYFFAWFWRILHYSLGLIGIVAAGLVALGREKYPDLVTGASVISALCLGFTTFMSPSSNKELFFTIWTRLDYARNRYEWAEKLMTEELLHEMQECEKLLHPNVPPPTHPQGQEPNVTGS